MRHYDILADGMEYHRFNFPSQNAMNGRQSAIIRGKQATHQMLRQDESRTPDVFLR